MKKLLILFLFIPSLAFASQWRNGNGGETPSGSTGFNDIDEVIDGRIVQPLDSLLANYRSGVKIKYNSASQLTLTAGEVTVSNSDGSVRLMLSNSGDTTVTWSDIDTGSEASNTTYYVYAVATSTSQTTISFKISTSSTSPSGITYYKKLGSFLNDSSSDITATSNDNENIIIIKIFSRIRSKI
jgi:hypothetical protein